MNNTLSQSFSLKLLQVIVGLFLIGTALALAFVLVRVISGHALPIDIFGQPNPNPPAWLIAFLLLFTLVMQWLIWHLYRVIGRARQGNIFSMQNVRDLRLLGFASLAWWTSPLWLRPLLTGTFELGGRLDTSKFLGSPLTIALIFFVFAEVLREGIRLRASEQQLRREQELTI